MLFNSVDFAIFLPLTFLFYWYVFNKNVKIQNAFLFIISYFFYGFWDWRFLSLILFSTIVDFVIGIRISNETKILNRKFLLWISILVNIGFLGVFKYYDFFVQNFINIFTLFGESFSISSFNIVLPVGISFYTFQTLSYTIDIYKRKLEPTKDFISFAAFVSFFPQLVAGPIERATNLLPQFYISRVFNYKKSTDGIRQILWGLFKKLVIADNCAIFVDNIFNNYSTLSGSSLLFGALFFSFQIYADFSGYSDIAIGTSRLFGFELKQNFAFPYFSRNIAEFWRRWHISLSTWFRDYIYIPMGGSKVNSIKKIFNVMTIFTISGFWHGANWTFIFWGLINALFFLPLILFSKNRSYTDIVAKDKILPSFSDLSKILITFTITALIWVLFRSQNLSQAFEIYSTIFSLSLFEIPNFSVIGNGTLLEIILIILFFIIVEWIGRDSLHALEKIYDLNKFFRYLMYFILFLLIISFSGGSKSFIYFQF